MNSNCVVHVSAQKVTETTKSLKLCYVFNTNDIHFKIVRRRTEMTHQLAASELLWVARYRTRCWRVASKSIARVRAGERYFEHIL